MGSGLEKRSVWTFDFRACWLEDTTIDNVKSWWCGGKMLITRKFSTVMKCSTCL